MADLIKGNEFIDERGALRFFNDFDMGKVVRFYEIAPANTEIIRAWQGHQHEKKWFYCLAGSFVINLVDFGGATPEQTSGRPGTSGSPDRRPGVRTSGRLDV